MLTRSAKLAVCARHVAMGSAVSTLDTAQISLQRSATAASPERLGNTARDQEGVAQATTDQLIADRVINSRAGALALESARFARATLFGSSAESRRGSAPVIAKRAAPVRYAEAIPVCSHSAA